jgi:hypothetical protein
MRKNTAMLLLSTALAFAVAIPPANANDWGGFAGGLAGGIIAGAIAAQAQPRVIYVPVAPHYYRAHRHVAYAAPSHVRQQRSLSVAQHAPSSGPSGDDLRGILGN